MDVGKKIEGVYDVGSGGLAERHVVHEPNKGRGTKSVASLPWQGSKAAAGWTEQATLNQTSHSRYWASLRYFSLSATFGPIWRPNQVPGYPFVTCRVW